jgi:hypothetical protein
MEIEVLLQQQPEGHRELQRKNISKDNHFQPKFRTGSAKTKTKKAGVVFTAL